MGYYYGLAGEYLIALSVWIVCGLIAFRFLLLWRQQARQNPGRLRLINIALSGWMLLASLTGLELFFALFYDQTDSFNMTVGSKTWYRRHVEPYKNDAGFRDLKPLLKHPPAEKTVVWFMGDSFTFGHGVKRAEDRFSDLITRDLEQARPGRFEVSNLSDAGSHLVQGQGMMRIFWGNGYDPPDVLVYVLCLNDIEPFLPDSTERYKKMGQWGPPSILLQESYLLNFFWFRLQQSRQPDVQDYFGDLVDAFSGTPGTRLLNSIQETRFICRSHNVDFRLVVFPFLHNLGPDYKFAAAHQRIVEYCRTIDVPVLDLRPALEPHVSEGLTVNRFDAHPNERAHAVAAGAIREQLLADLFSDTAAQSDRPHEQTETPNGR